MIFAVGITDWVAVPIAGVTIAAALLFGLWLLWLAISKGEVMPRGGFGRGH